MKGDYLPANDHVVRYCPGSKLAEDGTPLATAFYLRRNEKFLSVEWMEYLQQHAKDDPMKKVASIPKLWTLCTLSPNLDKPEPKMFSDFLAPKAQKSEPTTYNLQLTTLLQRIQHDTACP